MLNFLTGLVVSRSYAGNHSCHKFMSAESLSYPEDTVSPSSPLSLALKFSSTSSFVVILEHLGEGTLNRHFFFSELWPFVSFCTYLCLVHKDASEEFWLGPRLTTQSWDNVLVRWATISAFLSNSIRTTKTSTLCVTVLPCIMTVTNVKWLNEWVYYLKDKRYLVEKRDPRNHSSPYWAHIQGIECDSVTMPYINFTVEPWNGQSSAEAWRWQEK